MWNVRSELWEVLIIFSLFTHYSPLTVHKVKGHSGNKGNEIADRLAVLGKSKGKNTNWEECQIEF